MDMVKSEGPYPADGILVMYTSSLWEGRVSRHRPGVGVLG